MAIATDETNSDRGLGSDLTLGGDSRYSSHGQARAGSSRLQEFPPPDPEGLVGHHGVIYVVLHVLLQTAFLPVFRAAITPSGQTTPA